MPILHCNLQCLDPPFFNIQPATTLVLYIYIYMCVCVCMYVCMMRPARPRSAISSFHPIHTYIPHTSYLTYRSWLSSLTGNQTLDFTSCPFHQKMQSHQRPGPHGIVYFAFAHCSIVLLPSAPPTCIMTWPNASPKRRGQEGSSVSRPLQTGWPPSTTFLLPAL